MARGNLKMALKALKTSKWRSFLTMFGIIIGIVSVITTVSLGVGIKQQVVGQINHIGDDLISVRPGKTIVRDKNGSITHINVSANYGFGNGSLTEGDITAIKKTVGVSSVSPISLVTGTPKNDSTSYDPGFVLGTSSALPDLLRQKIEFGDFFSSAEEQRHVAVIGKRVAEKLFQENVPIGMSVTIRGQEFIIRGIFEEFKSSPLNLGIDLNKAVFIPYPQAKVLMSGNNQIVQVLARPDRPNNAKETIAGINENLHNLHQNQDDFTVLKQDENLTVTSDILNLLTGFIAAIAAISLLVGGIGIMNIMLVSVSERTREIGIRKAVGATNRQVLGQFLAEATVLSCVGGITGVIFALVVNFLIRIGTNFKPVITWQVVLIATGVSILVGIIFGIAPAAKAARKDPIDALRYE